MGVADQPRWKAEFAELGRERVRSEVMLGRWPADKRSYARHWLERQDVEAWQARAATGKSTGGLSKLRLNRKLWAVMSGVLFGGFALYRLLRQFKAGF